VYHNLAVSAISETSTRPPGRPRNEDADRAILAAALRLLARDGYDRASVEAVAAEADVTRATVYRRYPCKAEMITAAVSSLASVEEPPPAADVREYVTEMLRRFREGVERSDGVAIVSSLYLRRREDPAPLEAFRERVVEPCHGRLRAVLGDARNRGELRSDCDIDLVLDLLFGSYLHRAFVGAPVPPDWAERVVAAVWPTLAN
jgi:AcrR family transcriptional regulator